MPNETTIGTQPDMLEYVTSVAAAWDCPISIHSNLQAFESHPRTADNLEVVRRWEEVRATHWLTDKQKKELQNLNQEHHLLLDEHGHLELIPYEQIIDVAGGSKEIRAFIFQRKGEYYVVFWHISANKKLELPIDDKYVKLYNNIGQEENIISIQKEITIVPADNRRYLKVSNTSKEQLVKVFAKAKIID